MEIKQPQEKLDKKFAFFHATSVSGTAMMIAAILASYLAVHLTDTVGLSPAAVSGLMFISTLWDAFNDPMMGVIADRTKTKWGRYRPYFLPAPVLLTIFAVLLWQHPTFSGNGNWWYFLIVYIGYQMTVTMYTMPQMSVLPAHVKSDALRNKVITYGAGATAIMFTIGSSYANSIKNFLGNLFGVENGWVPLMLILGALSCVSFWGLFATSKEKYIEPLPDRPLTEDLKRILKHKELTPFIIVWVMASLGYGLMFATSVYYVLYYLARPDLIETYMLVVSMGALVSMVVLLPIFLKFFKTGQRALTASVIGSSVCYIILFFFGSSNFIFLCVMTFIATALASMQNALVNVLVNDAIDYIQFTEGISANGVISSIKGFAQKMGNTFSNSLPLFLLGLVGYVAGAVGQQNEGTLFVLNFMRFAAPIITGLIMLFCLRFNPVEKHQEDIAAMKSMIRDHSDDNHDA
ncbi:MFS transporter [Streptococcus moroccensis]|uniref:Sugar (Glycoside-pentoside-hexuronide) transporter n=1 Tax=Streptococcus moroccensis TaxID=1451356 RepID=A0ABT9YU07_9STRE|nr:MFS transporter [Streptococcus moroccensis]MDQ0223189.1 sugar (glycoside-pentoside-hexuronide) transporter [Streptococcus moroccensis]